MEKDGDRVEGISLPGGVVQQPIISYAPGPSWRKASSRAGAARLQRTDRKRKPTRAM